MKKLIFLISCMLAGLGLFAQQIPAKPNPPRLVNDFVGLLATDQRDSLERKLVAYDDSTSNQVAIVIVGTLNDYDPVDYAVKLGREWGVGGKEFNNGVIILISTGADGSQRKAFIAPGYGLEGAIPDITAQRIVDNELIPYLKEKDYYRALDNTTNAIIKAAAGEYKAPEGYANRGNRGSPKVPGRNLFPVILGIFVLIWIISRRGGGGGRGGGFMSRRGYRNSAPPIWWFPTGGGGGGWSGGGGFGGGGGGGFGGFGGGSFGGGGAGGNW